MTPPRKSRPAVPPLKRGLFRCARAFTLIEVMVVLTIMALLAGGAALSFAGPLRAARSREALQQLRYFDASARDLARRSGRAVAMRVDLSANLLVRTDPAHPDVVTYRATLPHGYRVAAIRTASRYVDAGELTIVLSPIGVAPTYAIKIVGPGLDGWVVFSGLTGESFPAHGKGELDAMFNTLNPRRAMPAAAPPPAIDPPGPDAG